MMKNLYLALAILLVAGCTKVAEESNAGGTNTMPEPGDTAVIACILSATESDPWASGIVSTVSGDLGIDPWGNPSTVDNLAVLGPSEFKYQEHRMELYFVYSGLTTVATLDEQVALGDMVLEWLAETAPDVVWIDGDVGQFQVGARVSPDIPVVFSGVVLDASLYYDQERPYTGVYKRHSMPAVFGELWAANPEAKHYGLLSDDSPMGAVNVQRFVGIQEALPEGSYYSVMPTVTSWAELADAFANLPADMDAVIVCAMGGERCSQQLLDRDCPADLLDGVGIPVVALGPTLLDSFGVMAVSIKPAAHARLAFEQAEKVAIGTDPFSLRLETPDDMAAFKAMGAQEDTL